MEGVEIRYFMQKIRKKIIFFPAAGRHKDFHLLGIVGLNLTVNFLLTVGDHVKEVQC